MDKAQLDDELERSGLKLTKHRSRILTLLMECERPMSAEDIFMALKERGLTANLSTVYRTLEALTEADLATKVNIPGDTRAFFEYKGAAHRHHLICLGCSRVLSLDECPLGNYEEELARQTGFAVAGHMLDIYGYCPDCQKKPEFRDKAEHTHEHH